MRTLKRILALGVVAAAAASCGDVVRNGRSPVTLMVNSLGAIRGGPGGASSASGFLLSDVITIVTSPAPCSPTTPCPTVFDDTGEAHLGILLKDPGATSTTPATPSPYNAVTITRVHVKYVRTDGRNTQGVDVPYEFDEAVTGTVTGSDTKIDFELVRHTAKAEPPLAALVTSPNVVSTIAQITFYGVDQVGNDVTATAQIQVNFGNFGDQS